jgi:hypothetical protein
LSWPLAPSFPAISSSRGADTLDDAATPVVRQTSVWSRTEALPELPMGHHVSVQDEFSHLHQRRRLDGETRIYLGPNRVRCNVHERASPTARWRLGCSNNVQHPSQQRNRHPLVQAERLCVGGFLGMGEKEVAVPFNAVRVTNKNNNKWYLVMNSNKDALKNAKGFKYDRSEMKWVPE